MSEATAPLGKLVRDRIPEIMAADGSPLATIELVEDRLFRCALLDKLVEEALEARRAGEDQLPEEIADVLEVLDALLPLAAPSASVILALKSSKRANRGGFQRRLFGLGLVVRSEPAQKLPEIAPRVEVARAIHLDRHHYVYQGVVYDRRSFDDPAGYDPPRALSVPEQQLIDRISELQDALATYAEPDDWYLDEMDQHWRFFGHDQGPYLAQRTLGMRK